MSPLPGTAAVVRLYWGQRFRSFLNGPRGARRRDGAERLSRATEFLLPFVTAVLFLPVAGGAAFLSFRLGLATGGALVESADLLLPMRILLGSSLAVIGAVVLFRGASGTDRASALLLLPIPRRTLLVLRLAGALSDPWVLASAISVQAFAAGALVAGRIAVALVAAVAGGVVAALLAAMSATLSLGLARLLSNRRRRDLALVLFLAVLSIGPFLMFRLERAAAKRNVERAVSAISGYAPGEPRGLRWIPTECWAAAVGAAAAGRPARAALAGAGGLALAALFVAAAAVLHGRSLDEPPSARTGKTFSRRFAARRAAPTLALARATLLGLVRTVPGKMVLFLNPLLLAGMTLIASRISAPGGGELPPAIALLTSSPGVLWPMTALLLLSVSGLGFNAFGTDGAGLTLGLLLPVRDREHVAGKILGLLAVAAWNFAAMLALAGALSAAEPRFVAAAFLSGLGSALLVAPVAVLVSTLLPKRADLSSLSTSANQHELAGLLSFLTALAAGGVPTLVALRLLASGRGELLLPAAAAWLLLAAVVAVPVGGLAARAFGARRENLALVAGGR